MTRLFQILIAVVFLLVVLWLIGYFIFSNIDFKVNLKGLNFSGLLSQSEIITTLGVKVENRNPFGLPSLQSPEMKLYYKDKLIGETENKYNQTIKLDVGEQNFERKFKVYLVKEVFELLSDISKDNKPEIGYRFKGKLVYLIPINYKGKFIYEKK